MGEWRLVESRCRFTGLPKVFGREYSQTQPNLASADVDWTEFDAVVHEFRPWHDYEKIERAWASKRAQGYRFNDLNIRSRTHHIVSLATRLRMLDAPLVKNSVIGNIPQLITLEMDGLVPNLIPAAFYTTKITETIIKAYWAEKEDGLL